MSKLAINSLFAVIRQQKNRYKVYNKGSLSSKRVLKREVPYEKNNKNMFRLSANAGDG